jgi:hypothetical protein
MKDAPTLTSLLIAAIVALAGAVVYLTTHVMKAHRRELSSKDKQYETLIGVTEKVASAMKDVSVTNEKLSNSIVVNTEYTKSAIQASQKHTDVLNEIHIDILKTMQK